MILYLDTSSLVKLFVAETHSSQVRAWTEKAEILATCRVAYPEAMSAFNKRWKTGDLSQHDCDLLTKTFAHEWRRLAIIDFDEIAAGRLVTTYGLRGFDAVHLSAAGLLRSERNAPTVAFSSFDDKLNSAATAERFTVLRPA